MNDSKFVFSCLSVFYYWVSATYIERYSCGITCHKKYTLGHSDDLMYISSSPPVPENTEES